MDGNLTQISPMLGFSVTSIVNFDGKLYVGVITSPYSYESRGLVYRMDNDAWTLIGELDNQVNFLIGYKGHLYAGTGIGSAKLYRYVPESQSWIKVIEYPAWYGFRSAYVWKDWLYLGDWYWDKFARWNGTVFEDLGFYGGSCIYSFAEYGDYLYAGAFWGTLYRISHDPPRVERIWQEPDGQYIWALREYGGYLYIGTAWNGYSGLPEGRLYRYNGTHIELVWSKSVSYRHEGVISLMTDGMYLFVGVGGQAVGYPGSPEKETGVRANATQAYPFYMPANGVGQIWQHDGESFKLIADSLGTGVQSILPGVIKFPLWTTMKQSTDGFEVNVKIIYDAVSILWEFIYKPDWLKVIPVFSFITSFYDRNGDGKITIDEIEKNIREKLPLTVMKESIKFMVRRFLEESSIYLPKFKIEVDLSRLFAFGFSVFSVALVLVSGGGGVAIPIAEQIGGYIWNVLNIFAGSPEWTYSGIRLYNAPPWTLHSVFDGSGHEKIITTAFSKVDLQVIDQYGRIINKTINQIPNASYVEADLNGDGELDDRIILPKTAGSYVLNISVIPEPSATANDTFTLVVGSAGVNFTVAKNMPISEIPARGYVLSSEVPPKEAPPMLSVRLNATVKALNVSNSAIFGAYVNATDGFDVIFDEQEPPAPPPPYVSLYFYYPGNPLDLQRLSTSYVNLTNSMSWLLRVEYSGPNSSIKISWATFEVNHFPPEYRLLLHTPEGLMIDMRNRESYVFNATSGVYSFNITAVKTGLVKQMFTLYAGINMFSIPLLLNPSDLVVQIGEVYPLNVFSYDPDTLAYVVANVSEVGRGYWIKVPRNVTVEVEGYPVPDVPFVITLRPGWNLIGHPFGQPVNVSSLKVFNPATGETLSFKEAVARGWIYKNLYWYDPVARKYVIISLPNGILEPFKGYWIKAYVNVKLVVYHIRELINEHSEGTAALLTQKADTPRENDIIITNNNYVAKAVEKSKKIISNLVMPEMRVREIFIMVRPEDKVIIIIPNEKWPSTM